MGVLRDQADDAVQAEAGAEAIDEVGKFGLIVPAIVPETARRQAAPEKPCRSLW